MALDTPAFTPCSRLFRSENTVFTELVTVSLFNIRHKLGCRDLPRQRVACLAKGASRNGRLLFLVEQGGLQARTPQVKAATHTCAVGP